eukprot:CAMPEP_0174838396 /NCGR_PEP_ID=MMETSP1114-20130205/7366_1 /TAXON_ID=312471 /ORGANISM="Neobodo designis, Strain CCAP 1951/1" /LENGTH=419 /DNA_ID=CAMNT_0016072491 /DNA_START=28 /DNA_END=1285 /DNA_ORIENTATION=+
MTELQRRAQQPDLSFGDELSRVGPRIIDWATLATCCARVTAPRIAFEGFTNTTMRVPDSWRGELPASGASPTLLQRFQSRMCNLAVPVRAGALLNAAPGVSPSLSFAVGAGGRSLSFDGEVTVDPARQSLKHCTVNIASPESKRLDIAVRAQRNQIALFAFRSLGRDPLWHMPVPAAAELQASSGGWRDLRRRWAQRLDASREQHERLIRGIGTTRRPYVKVGAGFQSHPQQMMMPLLLGGIAAELTQRTTLAFHADVLHRTCTTLTSRLTDSLTTVLRLRCNLITKEYTTLDAAAEYRWLPVPPACELAELPADVRPSPAEVAFRASIVSARASVGFTSDNTLIGLSRIVGQGAQAEEPTLMSKICRRVSHDLRRAGDFLGPVRVTLGVSAHTDRLSPGQWVDANSTPRIIFAVSIDA